LIFSFLNEEQIIGILDGFKLFGSIISSGKLNNKSSE